MSIVKESIDDILKGKSNEEIKRIVLDKLEKLSEINPDLIDEITPEIVSVPGNFSTQQENNRTIINLNNFKAFNVGLYAYKEVAKALISLL